MFVVQIMLLTQQVDSTALAISACRLYRVDREMFASVSIMDTGKQILNAIPPLHLLLRICLYTIVFKTAHNIFNHKCSTLLSGICGYHHIHNCNTSNKPIFKFLFN